jgi:hypothetical protein
MHKDFIMRNLLILLVFGFSLTSLADRKRLTNDEKQFVIKGAAEVAKEALDNGSFKRDHLRKEFMFMLDELVTAGNCLPRRCDSLQKILFKTISANFDGLPLDKPASDSPWTAYKKGRVEKFIYIDLGYFLRPNSFGGIEFGGGTFQRPPSTVQASWRASECNGVGNCDLRYDAPEEFANLGENASYRICKEGSDPPLGKLHNDKKANPNNLGMKDEACNEHTDCLSMVCNRTGADPETGADLVGNEINKGVCAQYDECYAAGGDGDECSHMAPLCQEGLQCLTIDYNSSNVPTCKILRRSCTEDTECCSDKCMSGECVEKMACLSCTVEGVEPSGDKECCPGLIPGIDGKCRAMLPPFVLPDANTMDNLMSDAGNADYTYSEDYTKRDQCIDPCNEVKHLPVNFPAEAGLGEIKTRAQLELEEVMCSTTAARAGDNFDAVYNACLDAKVRVHVQKLTNYFKSKDMIAKIDESQLEYNKTYGIPAFTPPGRSDPKDCHFNSLNDWIHNSSNLQRNAEIALAAMEIAFSGPAANTYFKDGDKGDINQRFKVLGTKIKEVRGQFRQAMADADIRMTCNCMMIKGEDYIKANQDRFQYCTADVLGDSSVQDDFPGDGDLHQAWLQDQKELMAALGIIEDEDTDNTQSFTNSGMGAAGLTGQGLLLQWLGERKKARMEMFEAIASVESDLYELGEYLDTDPWLKGQVKASPEKVYSFVYRKYRDWVKWVVAIVMISVALVLLSIPPLQSMALGALAGFAGYGFMVGAVALITSLFNGGVEPGTYEFYVDKNKTRISSFNAIREKFRVDRHVQFPENEICNAKGFANTCIKNYVLAYPDPYQVNNPEYKPWMDKIEGAYLIDFHLPETFPATPEVSLEMNPDLPGRMELGYNYGFNIFKTKGPSGTQRERYLKRNPFFEDTFTMTNQWKAKSGFVTEPDVTQNKLLIAFTPWNGDIVDAEGKLVPKHHFDNPKIEAYKNAVIEYINTRGLDYLFASTGEKKLFASYVYNIHLLFPKLSGTHELAYPMRGLKTYTMGMHYQFMLLGSLNANKAVDLDALLGAQLSDWSSKFSKYNAEFIKTVVGKGSKNAKKRRKLFAAFRALDLATGAGLEDFEKMVNGMKTSDQEGASAGLSGFEAAARFAKRSRQAKKKEENWNKQMKGNKRKKAIERAVANFKKTFSTPTNYGGGGSSSAPSVAATNNSGTSRSSKKKSYNFPSFGSKKKARRGGYGGPSFGSSRGSSNSGDDYSSSNLGAGDSEVDNMISAAKKDKSLYELDPNDTLFTVVSKAYKRNLDLILVRRAAVVLEGKAPSKPKIDDSKKAELKELLKK